jgi:hypothetical protein
MPKKMIPRTQQISGPNPALIPVETLTHPRPRHPKNPGTKKPAVLKTMTKNGRRTY